MFSALIDISELSESIVSDTSELGHNMSYEQLYDRYQRYKLRYGKNRERLDKVSCGDVTWFCGDVTWCDNAKLCFTENNP